MLKQDSAIGETNSGNQLIYADFTLALPRGKKAAPHIPALNIAYIGSFKHFSVQVLFTCILKLQYTLTVTEGREKGKNQLSSILAF